MANIGSRIVPSLLVRDMTETLAFYQDKLSFRQTGCHPDDGAPVWAEVMRDGIVLQFYSDPPQGTLPTPSLSGTLYFFPDSVAGLAEEWCDVVTFEWGPEAMDYGQREFAIKDCNGYFLAFAEQALDGATGCGQQWISLIGANKKSINNAIVDYC